MAINSNTSPLIRWSESPDRDVCTSFFRYETEDQAMKKKKETKVQCVSRNENAEECI